MWMLVNLKTGRPTYSKTKFKSVEVFKDGKIVNIRKHKKQTIHKNRTRTRGDYLNPKWRELRAVVLKRDKHTCRKCGSTNKELHVHHLRYSGKIWDSPISDLVTLCKDCHNEIHSRKSRKKLNKLQVKGEMWTFINSLYVPEGQRKSINISKWKLIEHGRCQIQKRLLLNLLKCYWGNM